MRPLQNITGAAVGLEAYRKMKTRIITAVVLIPVLLLILLAAPKIVTALVWGAMLAVAAYELLYRTGLLSEVRLVIYAAVMAFAVSMWSYFGAEHAYGELGLLLFVGVLFAEMMISHVKITFDKTCMVFFAGAVVPFLLSSLVRIQVLSIGRYVILIPFIVAFGSDAGAYFAGRFFGQRKLAPVISQHKTVEGAIGGIFSAIVGMLLYALVMQLVFDLQVNYFYAIIYGLLGSLVGIFGDLCFSVVKRQTGIKDYGNIIPGHGGILDRFDSMMMVGPLMEALLLLIPVAV